MRIPDRIKHLFGFSTITITPGPHRHFTIADYDSADETEIRWARVEQGLMRDLKNHLDIESK